MFQVQEKCSKCGKTFTPQIVQWDREPICPECSGEYVVSVTSNTDGDLTVIQYPQLKTHWVEIDDSLADVLKDILNFKGLSIIINDDIKTIDQTEENCLTVCEGVDSDCWMFPYIFMKGIQEGWLKIQVDENHPKNKLNYINKLLKIYRGEDV